MKFIPLICSCLFMSAAASAQWEKPKPLTHTAEAKTEESRSSVQPQNPFQEPVKGDAGQYISFVNAKSSCGTGLKGIGVTNTSDKLIEAQIELTTAYNGHVNKKIISVPGLSPNEVSSIGCTGCTENTTFTTCFTYRIVSASFKKD